MRDLKKIWFGIYNDKIILYFSLMVVIGERLMIWGGVDLIVLLRFIFFMGGREREKMLLIVYFNKK